METATTPDTKVFAITCGKFPDTPMDEDEFMSFCLTGVKAVQDAAHQFITVIPDDLDVYQDQINAWDGTTTLLITNQDDDYFVFQAMPVSAGSGLPPAFHQFVTTYVHDV